MPLGRSEPSQCIDVVTFGKQQPTRDRRGVGDRRNRQASAPVISAPLAGLYAMWTPALDPGLLRETRVTETLYYMQRRVMKLEVSDRDNV